MGNGSVYQPGYDLPCLPSLRRLRRVCALLFAMPLLLLAAQAQTVYEPKPGDNPYIVEGISETIVYALGHSLRINGTAKNGAFAMGGDVIVQGIVDGDVAAIGGSVIQLEGARINGDVMVVGGTYRHADKEPLRTPGAQTIIYTGYEQELGNLMRNPKDLLAPHWSAAYIGLRLLAILFWFIVSLA